MSITSHRTATSGSGYKYGANNGAPIPGTIGRKPKRKKYAPTNAATMTAASIAANNNGYAKVQLAARG